MSQTLSDNLQCNAPKVLDNRSGRFDAGSWRPYNNLAEFTTAQPLLARPETLLFWVRSTTNVDRADLYTLDKNKDPYLVQPEVDLSNYYTKAQTNTLLNQKANLTANTFTGLQTFDAGLTGNGSGFKGNLYYITGVTLQQPTQPSLFIGSGAGTNFLSGTQGYANTAVGLDAGMSLQAGTASQASSNALFGHWAGRLRTTGSFNSDFGVLAGSSATIATNQTNIGYHTGRLNTGNNTTFVGSFAGETNTADETIGIGRDALSHNTSGLRNTAVGFNALTSSITAANSDNTAVGHSALSAIGAGSAANGFENTAVGARAGLANITGFVNCYFGAGSGQSNTGSNNLMAGRRSGQLSGAASNSVFLGVNAGVTTTGDFNILIGASVLTTTTGATNELNIGNTIYGSNMYSATLGRIGINKPLPLAYLHLGAGTTAANSAPLMFTSGPLNTTAAVGAMEFLTDRVYFTKTTLATREQLAYVSDLALKANLTTNTFSGLQTFNGDIFGGSTNFKGNLYYKTGVTSQEPTMPSLFIGLDSGMNFFSGTQGYANTAVGLEAGRALQTSVASQASSNSFFGHHAGRAITTGSFNSSFGVLSGSSATTNNNTVNFGYHAGIGNTGSNTVFVGAFAGAANTADENTGVGKDALRFNSSGARNTATGYTALTSISTHSDNTAYGHAALSGLGASSAANAFENTAVGSRAGLANISGFVNSYFGSGAGQSHTGDNSVMIGRRAGQLSGGGQRVVYVGTNAGVTSTGNDNILIGHGALTTSTGASNELNIGVVLTGANMYSSNIGRIGINKAAPLAFLHLGASTGQVSTAPLKFTSGTLLTAPEIGAEEFLTDRRYFTKTTGATRETYAWLSDLSSLFPKSDIKYGNTTVVMNGTDTVFNIAHGLGSIPASFAVTFEDAGNLNFVQSVRSVDTTNITFTCSSAPVAGSQKVYWQVYK